MAQNTMTEKDMFLSSMESEFAITLRTLKAYPPEKLDYRPAAKSRTARELAWVFVQELGIMGAAIQGKIDFSKPIPPAPAKLPDILGAYEKTHREVSDQVRKLSEQDFYQTVAFPVGPGKMADLPRSRVFWMTLTDSIHHRGQLSVYLRLVGAKVPSIYGPSADEPWM